MAAHSEHVIECASLSRSPDLLASPENHTVGTASPGTLLLKTKGIQKMGNHVISHQSPIRRHVNFHHSFAEVSCVSSLKSNDVERSNLNSRDPVRGTAGV